MGDILHDHDHTKRHNFPAAVHRFTDYNETLSAFTLKQPAFDKTDF
ncbi:hypothetical protein P4H39_27190 [Paenibacillus lautus]|nr:hypothetical protein [Paenibacillus lautus]MEC0206295.1 hypothetical protein [Paenibacillus lautus]